MPRRLLSLAAVPLIAGAPVSAQNALGDGRALDSNLQQGTGGMNSRVSDLSAQVRFQNGIVTGNAPGGLAFRGDVGYRAPGEFTGNNAGDLNYDFRRQTFFSGLAGQGIRGTEALQMQFGMLSGGANNTNLRGTLELVRPNTGALGGDLLQPREATLPGINPQMTRAGDPGGPPPALRAVDPADEDYQPEGDLLWQLRTTSYKSSTDTLRPDVLDIPLGGARREWRRIMTSPLGGFQTQVIGDELEPVAEAKPGPGVSASGRGGPLDLQRQSSPLDGAVPPEMVSAPAGAEALRTYENILDEMRSMAPVTTPGVGGEADEGVEAPATWRDRILELRRSLLLEPEAPAPGEAPAEDAPDADTVELIRESGGNIEALGPAGGRGIDPYSANMRRGEELLAQGAYLDAEERFARALAARPDDPMASIGRVHSEIGAGMYLSATMNLRMLLATNPEIIGATYASNLLPLAEQLRMRRADLRSRLQAEGGLPREAGLVLAYIGYQTGDRAVVREGLDVASEQARAADDGRLGRLVEVLRGVWLDPDAAPSDD